MELGEWRRISLPGRFAKCYAQGSSVVFLTANGQAFLWSWGGKTIEMNVDATLAATPDGCTSCLQKVPGVMFLPTDSSVVFLTWVYKPASTGEFKQS